MLPLMLVASISFAISKRFEKHSMDVKDLAKGHAFTSNKIPMYFQHWIPIPLYKLIILQSHQMKI
jgi:hypothetical protein